MALYYSAVNLINVDTLFDVSTEDTLYVKENLYGLRPSKPFYFTVKAAQWVKIDLLSPLLVNVCGIFNHNFTSSVTITVVNYSDAWTTPVHTTGIKYRLYDIYRKINQTAQYWKLNVSDGTNSAFPRIGELWFGLLNKFPDAHLQPGRDDGVEFYASEQQTAYGQDWDVYLSESKRLKINFMNLNDPDNIDAFETFLSSIRGPEGRFLLIPDIKRPHVFLVKVVGSPAAHRIIYGSKPGDIELRSWSLDLKVLSRGITLL
jgi:hypothetical protein